jgi:hemerythrin-like domain-containing protein
VNNPRWLSPLAAFLAQFVEGSHHVKEDTYLLPKLARYGFTGCGSDLSAMVHEHGTGRAFSEMLSGATAAAQRGDARALDLAANALLIYAGLLRAGISDEEDVIFPLAERVLTPEDSSELEQAFAQVDSAQAGGLWEGFCQLSTELNRGRPDERPGTVTATLPPPSSARPTSPPLSSSSPGIP